MIDFLEDTKKAFETLADSLSEELMQKDEFLIFLIKQCQSSKDVLTQLLQKILAAKNAKNNKDLLLFVSEIL